MGKNLIARVPARWWGYAGLALWGVAVALLLVNRGNYDIDEGSARVMLFLWSVADRVANPIVTLGVPDFRAVFLIPAGFLFAGSLFAGKLLTLVLTALTALSIFHWRARTIGEEGPMLATGLLLLAPLAIGQLDGISTGPYLAAVLVAGAWVDDAHRREPRPFGGYYFAQLLLVFAAISLHPAGLAYPIALAGSWLRRPPPATAPGYVPGSLRLHLLIGVALVAGGALLLAAGWPLLSWFGDPLTALSWVLLGAGLGLDGTLRSLVGGLVLLALVGTLVRAWRSLADDLLGLSLALAVLLALPVGDAMLSYTALLLLLYWGFPALLAVRVGLPAFPGQRGAAFALLVVLATLSMSIDRVRYQRLHDGVPMAPQDRLLASLADLMADAQEGGPAAGAPRAGPRVASQWPGRTMIACACNTLPLPPAGAAEGEGQALLAQMHGVEYLVFDPREAANAGLSRQLALLGGQLAETLALQPGGVIVRLHAPSSAAPPLPPPEPEDVPPKAPR